MDSSSFASWNNFFLSAGIPNGVANEYAITFSQHRIRMDMLKEITKEILLDMGIKAMGDIIAILRQAKNISTQNELKISSKPSISVAGLSNGSNLNSINSNLIHHNHNHSQITPSPASSRVVSLDPLPQQQQQQQLQQEHQQLHQKQQLSTRMSANDVQSRTPQVQKKPIAQRVSITTNRSSPTISQLVGGKMQSRVSMNSGALTRRLGRIEKTNNIKRRDEPRTKSSARPQQQSQPQSQQQQLKSTVFARLGGKTR